jgi:hypothetical protein
VRRDDVADIDDGAGHDVVPPVSFEKPGPVVLVKVSERLTADQSERRNQIADAVGSVDVDGPVIAASSTASQQDYYDNLGRLTRTQDVRATDCTTRTYGFSAASERTSFASWN